MNSNLRFQTASSTSSNEPPSVELRASVLDAAISLGFRNSVMAQWMFDPNAGEDGSNAAEVSFILSPSFLFLRLKA